MKNKILLKVEKNRNSSVKSRNSIFNIGFGKRRITPQTPKMKKFFKDDYRWSFYKKNFFVIYFYVYKFISELKKNLHNKPRKSLNLYHYQMINDLSFYETNNDTYKDSINKKSTLSYKIQIYGDIKKKKRKIKRKSKAIKKAKKCY